MAHGDSVLEVGHPAVGVLPSYAVDGEGDGFFGGFWRGGDWRWSRLGGGGAAVSEAGVSGGEEGAEEAFWGEGEPEAEHEEEVRV